MSEHRIILTKTQSDKLQEFCDAKPYPKVYREWVDLDRGNGKTTLLRTVSLVESQKHPVIVFTANTVTAKHFVEGMPEYILKTHQYNRRNFVLHHHKGIRVLPMSQHRFEDTLGLARECILVDDVQHIDRKTFEFHASRAKKMFVCGWG